MIKEYMKQNNIPNLGYVINVDGYPHLFIMTDTEIMRGIPLNDKTGVYSGLEENDIALVGVNVMDDFEPFDIELINDNNMVTLMYGINILYIYTLKTFGLTINCIIDLNLLENLLDKLIKEFEKSITI